MSNTPEYTIASPVWTVDGSRGESMLFTSKDAAEKYNEFFDGGEGRVQERGPLNENDVDFLIADAESLHDDDDDD